MCEQTLLSSCKINGIYFAKITVSHAMNKIRLYLYTYLLTKKTTAALVN